MEAYGHLSRARKVIPVSAMQTRGFHDLREAVTKELKKQGFAYIRMLYDESLLKIAIIGRPNVEIRLLSMLWQERFERWSRICRERLVTRLIRLHRTQRKNVIIDTAGIRRAGKIGTRNIEQWSVLRSERAIERADVVAVVIDAEDGVTHQDEHLVGVAMKAKKGIVLVLNKWDKVLARPNIDSGTILDRYMQYLSNKFDFLSYAPVKLFSFGNCRETN